MSPTEIYSLRVQGVLSTHRNSARNVVAAALKRLAHRNPNVQLYTLTLVEALSKNCGLEIHREISSRAFTQGLEKLVTDRVCASLNITGQVSMDLTYVSQTTHDKVRKRVLGLVAIWSAEFEKDSSLGMMEECYENLKSKGATRMIHSVCIRMLKNRTQDTSSKHQMSHLHLKSTMTFGDVRRRNFSAYWSSLCSTRVAVLNGTLTRWPHPVALGDLVQEAQNKRLRLLRCPHRGRHPHPNLRSHHRPMAATFPRRQLLLSPVSNPMSPQPPSPLSQARLLLLHPPSPLIQSRTVRRS